MASPHVPNDCTEGCHTCNVGEYLLSKKVMEAVDGLKDQVATHVLIKDVLDIHDPPVKIQVLQSQYRHSRYLPDSSIITCQHLIAQRLNPIPPSLVIGTNMIIKSLLTLAAAAMPALSIPIGTDDGSWNPCKYDGWNCDEHPIDPHPVDPHPAPIYEPPHPEPIHPKEPPRPEPIKHKEPPHPDSKPLPVDTYFNACTEEHIEFPSDFGLAAIYADLTAKPEKPDPKHFCTQDCIAYIWGEGPYAEHFHEDYPSASKIAAVIKGYEVDGCGRPFPYVRKVVKDVKEHVKKVEKEVKEKVKDKKDDVVKEIKDKKEEVKEKAVEAVKGKKAESVEEEKDDDGDNEDEDEKAIKVKEAIDKKEKNDAEEDEKL